ncbi:MAG: signal recognition particle-docking protein FtsY [Longimicrobiales bacterium]
MGLFKRKEKPKKDGPSLWKRAIGRALPWTGRAIDAEALEELEEQLIGADFGVQATLKLVQGLEVRAKKEKLREMSQLREGLGADIRELLDRHANDGLAVAESGPTVYLMVGVNGVGKTTTIAKIAHQLVEDGLRVMVAAGDTYRAGAVEQLGVWAERVGADFIAGQSGGDPAAVAFDALDAALARGIDVLLVDTAGRLHTQAGLMDELAKIKRVIAKKLEGAPHESLLVLDATVGQNGLVQARQFHKAVGITGVVLSKMDSTAKGGIVVALAEELSIPIQLVGTGEAMDDLVPFDADDFVQGVLDSS